MGRLPHERAGSLAPAEHEADDQRPAGRAQRDAADTGHGDRDQPDEQPDEEPDREAARMELRHPSLAVAELSGDLAHLLRRGDDAHPVTRFEHHVEVREEVGLTPADAGDRRTVAVGEAERCERPSDDVVVRHDHPPEVEA